MKISAQVAVWLCAVFALLCLGVASTAFFGAPSVADPAERELSLGYAWFWTFLAAVALLAGVLSWLIKEGKLGHVD